MPKGRKAGARASDVMINCEVGREDSQLTVKFTTLGRRVGQPERPTVLPGIQRTCYVVLETWTLLVPSNENVDVHVRGM